MVFAALKEASAFFSMPSLVALDACWLHTACACTANAEGGELETATRAEVVLGS